MSPILLFIRSPEAKNCNREKESGLPYAEGPDHRTSAGATFPRLRALNIVRESLPHWMLSWSRPLPLFARGKHKAVPATFWPRVIWTSFLSNNGNGSDAAVQQYIFIGNIIEWNRISLFQTCYVGRWDDPGSLYLLLEVDKHRVFRTGHLLAALFPSATRAHCVFQSSDRNAGPFIPQCKKERVWGSFSFSFKAFFGVRQRYLAVSGFCAFMNIYLRGERSRYCFLHLTIGSVTLLSLLNRSIRAFDALQFFCYIGKTFREEVNRVIGWPCSCLQFLDVCKCWSTVECRYSSFSVRVFNSRLITVATLLAASTLRRLPEGDRCIRRSDSGCFAHRRIEDLNKGGIRLHVETYVIISIGLDHILWWPPEHFCRHERWCHYCYPSWSIAFAFTYRFRIF